MRRPAATNTGCMAGGIGLVGGVEMLLEEEEEEEEERACLWKDREEGWIWNSDTATATDFPFDVCTENERAISPDPEGISHGRLYHECDISEQRVIQDVALPQETDGWMDR
ncbi:hypothetical protein V1477_009483 [Vespula maculifrons]|uniref:Uncharacterized protein n=1 Tax=Vespula maculifrons TaxID=7453 RepID=A0ABD2CAS3_VESMC